MKFQRFELRHIKLDLTRPFETSFGRFTDRHLVIIKAFSDIGECYSEAPSLHVPFYSYETTQTTIHVLKDFIIPALLQKEIRDIEELHQLMEFVRGHNIAKSGIDTAFYHLMSSYQGKTLAQYLGGTRKAVDVGISLGIEDNMDQLLEQVELALNKSYKRIKIKIKPGWDIEPIRQIRQHFADVPLMADANSSFTLEHIDLFKQIDSYGLMMIEQPLGYDDIYEHSLLQRQIETPICLDESIETVSDAKLAVGIKACKVINIKLSRVGGIYPAMKIHNICMENGVPVWSGGMVESAIGKADCTALSTLPNFKLPGDISPSDRFFKKDIVSSGLVLKQGCISVPSGLGMGLNIDEKTLEEVTVESPIVLS
jgi:O-succinylbenzoate synthase